MESEKPSRSAARKALGWQLGNALLIIALLGSGIFIQQATAHPDMDLPRSECRIVVKDGYRYITANGIPNHRTGEFPNRGNPNSISAQKYDFRVPVTPRPAAGDSRGYTFGVAINGVPFDPGTAETWNGDMRWHYEALSGLMATRGSLGMDENLAHVQPTGAYHYHGLPTGLLQQLNYRSKMTLVGYAADGYPIYGPFCYTNAQDSKSALKMMHSSYKLKTGSRPSGDGPGGLHDGSFAQDYEWVKGAGDLDQFNGRVGVTPEYPHGTFYYVVTENWPYVPRSFRGQPDSSFRKFGPGGSAPGGGGRTRRPGAAGSSADGGNDLPPFGGPGGGAGAQGGGNGPRFGGPGGNGQFGGPGGGPPGGRLGGNNFGPPGGRFPPFGGQGGRPPGGFNGGPPDGGPQSSGPESNGGQPYTGGSGVMNYPPGGGLPGGNGFRPPGRPPGSNAQNSGQPYGGAQGNGNFPPRGGPGGNGSFPPQGGPPGDGNFPPRGGPGGNGNFPPQSGSPGNGNFPPRGGPPGDGGFPPQGGPPGADGPH